MSNSSEIRFGLVLRYFCSRHAPQVLFKSTIALGFLLAFLGASALITWLISHFFDVDSFSGVFFLVIIGLLNLIVVFFIIGLLLGRFKEKYNAYKKEIIEREFANI